jgi:methionyl aminopeptidase
MVSMKTEDEIKKLKRSGRVVALVFEAVADIIKPGVSTYEIDQVAERVIRKEGAIPSFLNYGQPPFPASTCISINDEVVHGIPRKDRIVQDGDIVSLDVGAVLDGYHGDAARTYIIGDVPKETSDLVRVTEECFWKAFEVTVTGNRIGDVSYAVMQHAESFGYGIVRELTGHGIGRNLHEEPDVPNYGKKGHGLRISPGLVICVEPMINLGTHRIKLLSDEWTIVTADGKPSAHYENTIAITADGPIITTQVDP